MKKHISSIVLIICLLAICISPLLAATAFETAETFRQENQPAQAIPYYQEALKEEPEKAAYILYNLGYCSIDIGKYTEAGEYLEKAIQKTSDTQLLTFINYDLGNVRFGQENFAAAAEHYVKTLELAPHKASLIEQSDLMEKLLASLYQTNSWDKIIRYGEEALSVGKKNDRIYTILGIAYYNKDNEKKSREALEQAIALNTNDAYAYFYLGTILLNDDPAKSIEYYKKTLEQNTENNFIMPIAVQVRIGLAYRNMNNNEQALDAFKKAYDIFSGLPRAEKESRLKDTNLLFDIGLAASKTERFAEARKYFEEALLYRDSYLTEYELGIVLLALKDVKAARIALEKALTIISKERSPDEENNGRILKALAATYFMGEGAPVDLPKALELLKKADSLLPDKDIANDIGKVYKMSGDKENARKYFKIALERKVLGETMTEDVRTGMGKEIDVEIQRSLDSL